MIELNNIDIEITRMGIGENFDYLECDSENGEIIISIEKYVLSSIATNILYKRFKLKVTIEEIINEDK
jgi:hypothetical protein